VECAITRSTPNHATTNANGSCTLVSRFAASSMSVKFANTVIMLDVCFKFVC
jgi:hypothetical protein